MVPFGPKETHIGPLRPHDAFIRSFAPACVRAGCTTGLNSMVGSDCHHTDQCLCPHLLRPRLSCSQSEIIFFSNPPTLLGRCPACEAAPSKIVPRANHRLSNKNTTLDDINLTNVLRDYGPCGSAPLQCWGRRHSVAAKQKPNHLGNIGGVSGNNYPQPCEHNWAEINSF